MIQGCSIGSSDRLEVWFTKTNWCIRLLLQKVGVNPTNRLQKNSVNNQFKRLDLWKKFPEISLELGTP
jgi:hypothetical protein